jgi:hypothetical protein
VLPEEGTDGVGRVVLGLHADRHGRRFGALVGAEPGERPPDLPGDDRARLAALRVEERDQHGLAPQRARVEHAPVVILQREARQLDPRGRLRAAEVTRRTRGDRQERDRHHDRHGSGGGGDRDPPPH